MEEKSLWQTCLDKLQQETPEQQIITWISPLHITETKEKIQLLAPNPFVMNYIKQNFLESIEKIIVDIAGKKAPQIEVTVGASDISEEITPEKQLIPIITKDEPETSLNPRKEMDRSALQTPQNNYKNNLNPNFTFATFVEGNSNRLAKAAALQVAENPGIAYNPLFIYGDVGLGKTHLMQATGSLIRKIHPEAKVLYLHSERFVDDMIKALQHNSIDQFKQYYRNLDVLLIDDIQFLSGKERSQEEFFYTFNSLLESQAQIILTSDRYPKDVQGLEERLTSRFGSGLTTVIETPGLETRVAILHNKAEHFGVTLDNEIAFYIAEKIDSNVRELEGVLRRVIASANLIGSHLTIDIVRNSLKDILTTSQQEKKTISIKFIQETVANYYNISIEDLLSDRRDRQLVRPRQIAMSLSKECTSFSLPEISKNFNRKDHTTVLHACKKIQELRTLNEKIDSDYHKIKQSLNHFF